MIDFINELFFQQLIPFNLVKQVYIVKRSVIG